MMTVGMAWCRFIENMMMVIYKVAKSKHDDDYTSAEQISLFIRSFALSEVSTSVGKSKQFWGKVGLESQKFHLCHKNVDLDNMARLFGNSLTWTHRDATTSTTYKTIRPAYILSQSDPPSIIGFNTFWLLSWLTVLIIKRDFFPFV